jgi:predicted membrane channel-forming protein YqfA (hemolysin III family)
MDSKTFILILISIIGLISIINILYQTDSKKREGFVQILILLSMGSLILVLVNELDNTSNGLIKKWSGAIIFLVITVFCFIYGYRKKWQKQISESDYSKC